MIHVNIDAFRQIGNWRIHFKAKGTLILCVFSGSDVRSKWRLLCSLFHPTTKHLNRSIGDILVFPCTGVDTKTDSSQLTQAGSKVRRFCQSTILGGPCTELRHSDSNFRTAWFEKGDLKKIKNKSGLIFIIIEWMCAHTSNTHLCSNIRWPL